MHQKSNLFASFTVTSLSLSITVYSPPCDSPSATDFDSLPLVPTCGTGLVSSCNDYLSSGMLQYSAAPIHPPPPPPSNIMAYSPPHYPNTSISCDIPCQPLYSPRAHPFVDSGSPIGPAPQLPMGLLDQTPPGPQLQNTNNPIQYYPENPSDFSFLDPAGSSPPIFTPQFNDEFMRSHHPTKRKRKRATEGEGGR